MPTPAEGGGGSREEGKKGKSGGRGDRVGYIDMQVTVEMRKHNTVFLQMRLNDTML